MPTSYLDTQDYNKAQSDLWEQQARQRLADNWAQQVSLRLPDIIGQTQQKLSNVLNPQRPATGASAPVPLPPPTPAPVAQSPTAAPRAPVASPQDPSNDVESYIRAAAQSRGIDPETAVKVYRGEGASSYVGDNNSSFGPFQLHYGNVAGGGNAVSGLGDTFTAQTGLDARDPSTWRQQVDFTLDQVKRGGWGPWHGAAAQGITGMQGVGDQQAASVGQPSALSVASPSRTASVSQFDLGLSPEDAYAFCGPAAAMAFANTYGRYPTASEAKSLAQKYGWTPQAGMAGIQSEQQLLNDGLGIPTKLETNVDWGHVASDASNGNPVIISTPGHYFTVGQDPATGQAVNDKGQFYVGKSGLALRGGSVWMTPAEMQSRMGQAQGALYADNPQTSGQSIASQVQSPNTGNGALDALGTGFSALGSAAHNAVGLYNQQVQQGRNTLTQAGIDPYAGIFSPRPEIDPLGTITTAVPQIVQGVQTGNLGLGGVLGGALSLGGLALAGQGEAAPAVATAAREAATSDAAQALLHSRQRAELNIPRSTTPRVPLEGGAGSLPGAPTEGLPPVAPAPPYEPHGLTINLPKFTPPEVRDIIQQSYDANPVAMDVARRGVIPDQVVKQLADATGSNVNRIAAIWKPGQAKNAETILALRQSLADQSQNVLAAQAQLRANPTDLNAQNALLSALTKHAAVQEVVTGVTAEAGRALRQFRQPVEGQQAALAMLQKMATKWKVSPDELSGMLARADLSDPAAVAGVARNLVQHTPADRLSALWYFNLLSSPLSHVRNVVSNTFTAAVAPLETIPSASIDLARSALSGAQRERFFGELPAQYVGLGAGMREGWQNALQILSQGFTNAQAAGKLAETAASREAFRGDIRGALSTGNPLNVAQAVGGATINLPGRALGAEDAFFRSINQTASLYAQAYRVASQEGLKGAQLADRVTQLRMAPTEEMLRTAEQEGAFRVFQNDGNLAQGVTGLMAKAPYLRFFVPFVRTPVNIFKYAVQHSPVGLGTLAYDALRGQAGTAGQVEDRLARVAIGSAITGGLLTMANDGNLTGAPPDSPTERDAYLRQHPAYSIKLGDNWYSYQALQPFSSLFAAVAAIKQAQDKGMRLEPAAAGTLVALSVAKSLTDMPWTQGLTQALDAQHNPQQMAGAYAESLARSAVFPTAFWSFVDRATDGMLRNPNGPVQAMQAQFAPTASMVPARQNAFGADIQRPAAQMGLGALNPFNPAPATNDPVEKALADLQMRGWTVEPGFVGPTTTVPRIPVQVQLTDDEQRQIQRTGGQLAYSLLLPIVTSPDWDRMLPAQRAQIVNSIMVKTRDYARAQLIPQLAPRAINQLQQELATDVRRPAPKP